MKNFYIYIFILFASLLAFSCVKHQKQIIVYGSSNCHHCTDFLAQLDSANLTYDFRDFMEVENKYDAEMLKKLDEAGFREYIHLPVADVEGQMFVKAEIHEVAEAALAN